MKRHLLAASSLALAACTSTPPATGTATATTPPTRSAAPQQTTPQPASLMAAVSGGSHVYEAFCAACHSGGDETAPELKTLHTFNRERVSTALSDKGLMALQATLINAAQREQRSLD